MSELKMRAFRDEDEAAAIALWSACDLTRPWNDPAKDIARKRLVQPELFLVGTIDDEVVATAMVGYEGHRGWVNYLAVDPRHRRAGHARRLMDEAEHRLLALGCPKINLQLRKSNAQALGFYRSLGYLEDEVVSLGKRLVPDR